MTTLPESIERPPLPELVIELLIEEQRDMTALGIAIMLQAKWGASVILLDTIKSTLCQMATKGDIVKVTSGIYRRPGTFGSADPDVRKLINGRLSNARPDDIYLSFRGPSLFELQCRAGMYPAHVE